jgi:hypothetical protein
MNVPDITPYLAESAFLGVLVSLAMGLVKTQITSDIWRLVAAWALSAVVGVAWVVFSAWQANAEFSIGQLLASVPAVWASSVAVWHMYKPVFGKPKVTP